MQLLIDHVTRYRYSQPASAIVQLLRMTPRDAECQHVRNWRIDINADGLLVPFTDAYGNFCHIFYADHPLETLDIHVTGAVVTADTAGVVANADEPQPPILFRRQTALTLPSPPLAAFAERFAEGPALAQLHALMLGIHAHMGFEPDVTDTVTDAATAFTLGRGVCQDLAQIFLSAARHLGHPARYVSGHYAAADHPEQEASHAWAEAHVPDLGWVSFDPTHGVSAGESHVRVAVGLDSLEAAPVRGSRRGGGKESLEVEVHGREDAPRSLPQTQWQAQD